MYYEVYFMLIRLSWKTRMLPTSISNLVISGGEMSLLIAFIIAHYADALNALNVQVHRK